MHEELKRLVEMVKAMQAERNSELLFKTHRFLATHGDALLAAVELAEATRRHYEACGPGNKFSALQMSLMDAAKNERKA